VSIEKKARASTAEPRGNEVTRIGILTPHIAPGPEAELSAMAPGRVMTCVARVPVEGAVPGIGGNPTTPSELGSLTVSPLLEASAEMFRLGTQDAIVYASTSAAYAIGLDDEEAVASRLARLVGIPVLATGASAVRALRVLRVGRVALVHPPWFDAELNELGADYFRAAGFEVVWSKLAEVSRDPQRVESAAVYEWTHRNVRQGRGDGDS
jgi:maleate isomerase